MGARSRTAFRLHAFAIAGTASAVLSFAAASPADASTATVLSLPGHYINNYGARAKQCSGLVTPPWVSWLSYADAKVSDEWNVYASSKKLCHKANITADAVIFDAPFEDGAGQTLSNMISYAENVSKARSRKGPKPAGPSWKCEMLPSFWGGVARDLGHGAISDKELAGASGPAAGAGFCELGAKKSKGKYKGGKFFSWVPNTLSCKRNYRLKSIPDPANPGQTTNPPFPANLWGDYDLISC